ncbi:MAG: DNA replication and repair protein RecF [Aureibaculum sp.]|nr:DNA replication and repair protein RecF [Aureibaculum sp.]
MSLELLKIYNARNLKEYTVSPHPLYNIFYGVNGAGKTTVLESVFLLLRSKTFRSVKYKSFINRDSNNCTVFAKFSHSDGITLENSFTLGISRSKDLSQPVIHLNSEKVTSLSAITKLVILGLITPQSFNLIDAGPSIRRKFIDWGVFHVEPGFLSDWKAYNKILDNRNTLLKKLSVRYGRTSSEYLPDHQLDNLNCWSPQLIELNNKLHKVRLRQVNNIAILFTQYLKIFSVDLSNEIKLSYYQGWNKDLTYEDYLQLKLKDDVMAGYTRYGTHRGDININIKNYPAKDLLSRGQKKIVIICLILAQFTFLVQRVKNTDHSLLLLDDIDSELDQTNLEILFTILNTIKSQVLVTSTNKDRFDFLKRKNYQLFHVEH